MQKVTYEGKQGYLDEKANQFFPKENFEEVTYEGNKGILHTRSNQFFPVDTSEEPTPEGHPSSHEEVPTPSIPERLWTGAKSDFWDLVKFIGQPQETGRMIGKTFATPEGREQLIRPIKESILHPTGIPERIKNYAIEHPLNTILNVLPFTPLVSKMTKAAELEPLAQAIRLEDYYRPPGNLRKAVVEGMEKGVRPSVVGQGDWPSIQKYYDKSESAVKGIIDNKKNLSFAKDTGETISGKTPKNLAEFSDAIDQTKKRTFEKYDALAKETGQTGLKVNLEPIAAEIEAASNDTWLSSNRPAIASKLKDLAESYRKIGALNPSDAQDWISKFNANLKNFYQNPSYEMATQASTEDMIVNRLRKSLDDIISQATGPGYQELKNEYGALSSIEGDVSHRYRIDARKNVKGLIDFTNVWSGVELARAITKMDPAHFATAGVIEGIKRYMRHLNNPNPKIASMFEEVERTYQKPIIPEVVNEPVTEALRLKEGVEPKLLKETAGFTFRQPRNIPVGEELGFAGPERRLLNAPNVVDPGFTFRPPGTILRKGYEVGIAPKEPEVFTTGPGGELTPYRLPKTPSRGDISIIGEGIDPIQEGLNKKSFLRMGPDVEFLRRAGKTGPVKTLTPPIEQGQAFTPTTRPSSPEEFLRSKLIESEAKKISGESPEKMTIEPPKPPIAKPGGELTILDPLNPPPVRPDKALVAAKMKTGEVFYNPESTINSHHALVTEGLDPMNIARLGFVIDGKFYTEGTESIAAIKQVRKPLKETPTAPTIAEPGKVGGKEYIVRTYPKGVEGLGDYADIVFNTREAAEINLAGQKTSSGRFGEIIEREKLEVIPKKRKK